MPEPIPPLTESKPAAPPFIQITVSPETSDINVQTNITLKPVILGLLEQAKWLILHAAESKSGEAKGGIVAARVPETMSAVAPMPQTPKSPYAPHRLRTSR